MLYEALTGARLYKRETDFEVCQAIIDDPVPSARDLVPEVSEHLDAIVQKALAKRPEDRFQSAGEMQQALQEFLADRRDVVPVQQLAERMRDLFPELYEEGPDLDTGTELLTSLSRLDGSEVLGGPSIPRPPGVPSMSGVGIGDEDAEGSVSATANTATVTKSATEPIPIGRGMIFAFLTLLLLALGLGGVAVWAIVTRPMSPEDAAPRQAVDPVAAGPLVAGEGQVAAEASESAEDALKGTLWITSEPPGADIYINSNPTGEVTPAQLMGIWPGRYRITLRLAGHDDDRMSMRVEAGQIAQASGTLNAWGPDRAERMAEEVDEASPSAVPPPPEAEAPSGVAVDG